MKLGPKAATAVSGVVASLVFLPVLVMRDSDLPDWATTPEAAKFVAPVLGGLTVAAWLAVWQLLKWRLLRDRRSGASSA